MTDSADLPRLISLAIPSNSLRITLIATVPLTGDALKSLDESVRGLYQRHMLGKSHIPTCGVVQTIAEIHKSIGSARLQLEGFEESRTLAWSLEDMNPATEDRANLIFRAHFGLFKAINRKALLASYKQLPTDLTKIETNIVFAGVSYSGNPIKLEVTDALDLLVLDGSSDSDTSGIHSYGSSRTEVSGIPVRYEGWWWDDYQGNTWAMLSEDIMNRFGRIDVTDIKTLFLEIVKKGYMPSVSMRGDFIIVNEITTA